MNDEEQIPFNNRVHNKLIELKQNIEEMSNGCSLSQQNIKEIAELKELLGQEIIGAKGWYDLMKPQLTELKEKMKIYEGAVINYNFDYDRIREVRKVLREMIILTRNNFIKIGKGGKYFFEIEKFDSFLENLDGEKASSASHTECEHESDIIVCRKCAHPDIIAMMDKFGTDAISKSKAQREVCPICDGSGVNIHVERDEIGLKKNAYYPCQCKKKNLNNHD